MNSLMMLCASLTVGFSGPEGATVYVPRTEVRESTVLVPRVVYDNVKVDTPVTVYDPFHYELVPGPGVAVPVQRQSFFRVPRLLRPLGPPVVVEKHKYKTFWRPF